MAYSRPPVQPGRALKRSPALPTETTPGVLDFKLDAEIATTTSLGVVQIGDGIDITPDGVISVGGSDAGCNTILVRTDYESTNDDCYIGVNSSGPVTITLPLVVSDGHQLVVKSEMAAPLGNRKITIKPHSGSTIDGATTYILNTPYASVHLIRRSIDWHIISSYSGNN